MKKMCFVLIFVLLLLTACSTSGDTATMINTDNGEIAEKAFNQLIEAIETKNKTSIKKLFAKNAINAEENFEDEILKLLDFYEGKIISFSQHETGAETEFDDKKAKKVLWCAFFVETNKQKYHIAFNLCPIDDFDTDNIGILSFYIINSKNWHDNYVYRGDRNHNPGINIVLEPPIEE